MMLLLQIMRQKESLSLDKKRVKSYFNLCYSASVCWCVGPRFGHWCPTITGGWNVSMSDVIIDHCPPGGGWPLLDIIRCHSHSLAPPGLWGIALSPGDESWHPSRAAWHLSQETIYTHIINCPSHYWGRHKRRDECSQYFKGEIMLMLVLPRKGQQNSKTTNFRFQRGENCQARPLTP